jgi:hypothetical protein
VHNREKLASLFSMSTQQREESAPDAPDVPDTPGIDFLSNSATMFVLSMVMASVLVVPTIIAATQASTVWRQFKKL